MIFSENPGTLRLRPHHIFCGRFLPLESIVRGEEFACAINRMKELTQSESDLIVTVTDGPDQLCDYCPECKNNRCENPFGNEEEVKKWDAKVLKGLGIIYGEEITLRALIALIREKAPLEFCKTRCPWKQICAVFSFP
jgi:hypothetical protein